MTRTRIRKDTWNTYLIRGFSHDVSQDQASAGGIHRHQIKRGKYGWLQRIRQSNGNHVSYSTVEPIEPTKGEACFEQAKTY